MATLLRLLLSAATFLFCFYSTTAILSYLYPLDTALLPF
jgi:hypothetical protein